MTDSGNHNTATKGVGFSGLLTIVFIVLKLCNVINWSWLWVLSPIWINILLVMLVFFVLLGIAVWNEKD